MKRAAEKTLCESCPNRYESVFDNLPKEQLQDIDREKVCYVFKKGESIFNEGGMPHGVYCIKYGKVKLYKTGTEGKAQIIRFAKEGDVIGYRSLLSGEKFNATAACLEETMVCFIPKAALLEAISNHTCLAMNLMKAACHELGEASNIITNLAQKSIRERLAEVLLILKENFGVDKDDTLNVVLSREEISSMVGTATESTIRLLSDFNKDGLIELTGKKIRLINIPGLVKTGKVQD